MRMNPFGFKDIFLKNLNVFYFRLKLFNIFKLFKFVDIKNNFKK